MSELKINAVAVLRAAKKSTTAKNILKELFPDVFHEQDSKDLIISMQGLEHWISSEIYFALYEKIPGLNSRTKAEAIKNLILEKWA